MMRVFAAKDPTRVRQVHELLSQNNIKTVTRGDQLSARAARFREVWPSVWIEDDSDADRTMKLLADINPKTELCHVAWNCKACGSLNQSGSTRCLSCIERAGAKRKARQQTALNSAILLLKLSAGFFVAFLIAVMLAPHLPGEANQRGADVFGIVACVAWIVILIWAMLEFSRQAE